MEQILDERIRVCFSRDIGFPSYLEKPFIQIIPDFKGWNDFNLRCRCTFRCFISDDIEINGTLYLGFLGESENPQSILKFSEKTEFVDAETLPQFFSIQGSLDSYRQIVRKLGSKNAVLILRKINDLVALRHSKPTPEWVKEAIASRVFALSLVRESERFFAFHNAGSILSGVEYEEFSKIPTELRLSFILASFEAPHQISFNFSPKSILPKRINVIIGKNGLGKSRTLAKIVESLQSMDICFTDKEGNRPLISRLLAIGTPGETINTFPKEKRKSPIKYRRMIIGRAYNRKKTHGFGELMVQLVRSKETIGERSRYEIFLNSLKSCLSIEDIFLPLEKDSVVSAPNINSHSVRPLVPLARLKSGSEQADLEIWSKIVKNSDPIRLYDGQEFPLSSGQLSFILFALQACLFIENGTLVLLDEPETHLHPNLITFFIEVLDNLLEATGSAAIIATHSAYFVREVANEQVIVFSEDEKGIVLTKRPTLKTFGANVGAISHFVFEDELANRLFRKIESSVKESKGLNPEIYNALKDDLSIEAIMKLNKLFSRNGL